MQPGAVEFSQFEHQGRTVIIQGMPNDEGGFMVEAIERGDRIGQPIHVDGPNGDDSRARDLFEAEKRRARRALETQIKSGKIKLPTR